MKKGTLSIALGLLLIAAALSLTGYNYWENAKVGEATLQIRRELGITENSFQIPPSVHQAMMPQMETVPPMPTQRIGDNDYIGSLTVPLYQLDLPIMADWSYDKLKVAPCVFTGSYFTGDLVICGHNYPAHFSKLKSIPLNADIYLNTVDGVQYHYIVDNVETVEPTAVEQMILPGDWDLTLFTCHTGGQTRCAIRCVLT